MAASADLPPKAAFGCFAVLLVPVLLLVAFCSLRTPAPPPPPPHDPQTDLVIEAPDLQLSNGGWAIVGTVRNNGPTRWRMVLVRFNVYDASGAQVGDTVDSVSNLDPRGVWKFSAPVPQSGVIRFKQTALEGVPE